MENKDYIRAWNERVGEVTAHIKFHDKYLSKQGLYAEFAKALFGEDLTGCSVIDWGSGGGLFSEWLFLYHNVKSYEGFDIAKRSIKAARERMQNYQIDEGIYQFCHISPDEFGLIEQSRTDFFICLSVIQHFPDKKYLLNFLQALNNSQCKKLILQIRHGKTKFQNEPYKTTHEIALACRTNAGYMKNHLPNYKLKNKSPIAKNGYQYLMFERK